MRISVVGTGYVGLVTGACLAERGHRIVCVDVDPVKVDQIKRKESPIFEKGLPELLDRHVGRRLQVTTDLREAVLETEVTFVAVGTPFRNGSIDLSQIREVCTQIGGLLGRKRSYHCVLIKSTVVPGTTDEVVIPLLEAHSRKKAGRNFGVGVNPEFLREGEAVDDFLWPDRIVMGATEGRTLEMQERVYAPFDGVDRVRTANRTAEMIKYASNALFATMISFSNEIGNLCAALEEVDVEDVLRGVHLDRRLSPLLPDGQRIHPGFTTYLKAGCGFGGSCFPKDVKALIAYGRGTGQSMRLLEATIHVNEEQPEQVVALLNKRFSSLAGVRVGVLGLAFKPGTDDMRESPAIPVVRRLAALGAIVQAYDPAVPREVAPQFLGQKLAVCDSLEEAIRDVDALVLLTAWPEFKGLPELLADRQPPPVLVDGRRMLDKRRVRRYEGIGIS